MSAETQANVAPIYECATEWQESKQKRDVLESSGFAENRSLVKLVLDVTAS